MALTDNLVAYWKLDEASGNAVDSAGVNTLTDNNTVGSATGKIGNARDFENGSDQYLSITDNVALSMGDIDFTVAGWLLLESDGDIMYALAKNDAGGSGLEYAVFNNPGAGSLVFAVSNDGSNWREAEATSLGVPSTATWYFVVGWHNATANTVNIQVNNGTVDSYGHTTGVINGTAPFSLGAQFSGGSVETTTTWDGLLDEWGVWKRVLTATERTQLYNGGAGLTHPFSVSATHRPLLHPQAVRRASRY